MQHAVIDKNLEKIWQYRSMGPVAGKVATVDDALLGK